LVVKDEVTNCKLLQPSNTQLCIVCLIRCAQWQTKHHTIPLKYRVSIATQTNSGTPVSLHPIGPQSPCYW